MGGCHPANVRLPTRGHTPCAATARWPCGPVVCPYEKSQIFQDVIGLREYVDYNYVLAFC